MEATDSKSKSVEVKDIPPVPLKTYHWEDVRRAKEKGAYPYTHISKGQYEGEVNPEEYTMEAFRRSKSASTLGKSETGVVIQEITDTSKVTNKDYLDVDGPHMSEGIVESAESSAEDNISQYLDGPDDRPEILEQPDASGSTKEIKNENMDVEDKQPVEELETEKNEERAKSEEPKRKRKLSLESSYSRISLSRLSMVKKLRDAKNKIKLPKFNFSKSDSKLHTPKKKNSKKETDTKNGTNVEEKKKVEGPLYIHIPLKPPPGETDEFSHLEFEDPRSDSTKPTTPIKEEIEKIEDIEDKKGSRSDVQIIFLTAPSDDEVLDDNVIMPDTPSSDGKKFFEPTKIKELKTLAKGVVNEIKPGTNIDGIIFEDVIQVEYVDENNRPIGTTEKSKFIEVNEETLPKLEKQLSNRNIFKELQEEIRSSRESLNKLMRQKSRGQDSPKIVELKDDAPKIKDKKDETLNDKIEDTIKIEENNTKKTIEDKKKEKPKKKKKMEKEDNSGSKPELNPTTSAELENPPKDEKITVDEEDGLKTKVAMTIEEKSKDTNNVEDATLAKNTSPLKKKVSFRRKSKQDDPDGIYEDVQVTDAKEKGKELKVLDTTQSMSVDEEKTYLDEKIMKTTSLEENYNKWSKLPDHEYEPVNPPPDDSRQENPLQMTKTDPVEPLPKPQVCCEGRSIRIPLHEDVLVQSGDESPEPLTATEMQKQIEDRFFNVPVQQTNPTTTKTTTSNKEEPGENQAKKIQEALKNQAGRIRTKFKNIKRPNISLPQRPNFDRFKLEKPKMLKLPDQVRINLPSFTLPKKSTKKRPIKERQFSTESNVGDSKKKIFDFSTYPRIFGKKKKPDDFEDEDTTSPESSTIPRTNKPSVGARWARAFNETKKKQQEESKEESEQKNPDIIRIPLHSEESMDRENFNTESASRSRYDEDIDMDDAYVRESQEMHRASPFSSDFSRNRWNHGSFHSENLHEIDRDVKVTDLDNETPPPTKKMEIHSLSSSGDIHRRGVLEEINSDEFFLRQKGISQDDIEMGALLSSEIREAFRQPINPLSKMQIDDDFDRDLEVSDQSLQETPKRKPIKKPKRKKTPHVSQEQVSCDQESTTEPEEYPKSFDDLPPRPTRKSKKKRGKNVVPYQETIASDEDKKPQIFEATRKCSSDNVLNDQCEDDRHFYDRTFKDEYPEMYENERMKGIEQPNILISDPYHKKLFQYADDDGDIEEQPCAPPRKQKSLKSLNSEHDSIIDEISYVNQGVPQQNIETYRMEHEYIIPTPEEPPIKPARTRSRTRSHSRATTQPDDELPSKDIETPESPCVEEPCVSKLCDYMGYAIIDKSKQRDPPLPPPPRRKRSLRSDKPTNETKFFTVPRPLNDEAPRRPLRNYSTLVPRSNRSTSNVTEDGKENFDGTRYIEIEDDARNLQSGIVIQKMKDRPLPAPPRPPRKPKDGGKSPLKDITHEANIEHDKRDMEKLDETEVSVQTEPLPDDFICEEFVQDKNDKIITPSSRTRYPVNEYEHEETITHGALIVAPVHENFEEGPITSFDRSTERIITVKREVNPQKPDSDDETSEIPEDFKKLKEPQPKIIERIIERPISIQPDINSEIEILKTQKLQVSDLDVDRLTVNELLAGKITVSEIDSGNINVTEINPKSGNIVISGIELPASFLQELIERFNTTQAHSQDMPSTSQRIETIQKEEHVSRDIPTVNIIGVDEEIVLESSTESEDSVQDSMEMVSGSKEFKREILDGLLNDEMKEEEDIEIKDDEDVPMLVPDTSEEERLIDELKIEGEKKTPFEEDVELDDPPQRPPRQSDFQRRQSGDDISFDTNNQETFWTEESVPQRPPQPEHIYLRSQPPPSFYMLRSPLMDDFADDIPLPPRRKRPPRVAPQTSSDEITSTPRERRHRTPEQSIPQLTAQLTRACTTASERALKRLIKHITTNVMRNADGQQDLHVFIVLLLVLIAGLILLRWGDNQTIHYHHWEYFNPPKDL